MHKKILIIHAIEDILGRYSRQYEVISLMENGRLRRHFVTMLAQVTASGNLFITLFSGAGLQKIARLIFPRAGMI